MTIYLISGKAGSGKNTVSKLIKEYYGEQTCEIAFAKHLKQYAKDYFGWDGKEETKPRKLLQTLGTDIIRNELEIEDFHADRLVEDIYILQKFFNVFVIPDCRFPNEIGEVVSAFGDNVILIRVNRNNNRLTNKEKNHESETALDNWFGWDHVINNNGTLEELKGKVINIIKPHCDELER